MQKTKSKGKINWIDCIFFIYLLSTILEKFKWNIFGWGCDLFTLCTAIFFVVLFVYFAAANKKIVLNKTLKALALYFFVFLVYCLFQFPFLQHIDTIHVQYVKGVITFCIQIIAFFNFVMLINLLGDRFSFEYIAKMFYYITIVNVLYCIVQSLYHDIDLVLIKIFKSDVTRWGMDSYGKIGRVTGLLLESNFNGAFLLIGFINEVGMILRNNEKKKSKKVVLLIFTFLTLLELIFTFSRTAYLGFAVFGLYFFIQANKELKKIILFLGGSGLLVAAVLFFVWPAFQEIIRVRFSFLFGDTSIMEDSHFKILIEAMQIYTQNFITVIFGVGRNCLNCYYQSMFGYEMMKAHNYYVQTLCEMGIIGLGLFLYYLYVLWHSAKNKGLSGKIFKMIIIATIFTNFTYDSLERNFNIVLLIFALALALCERQSEVGGTFKIGIGKRCNLWQNR